MKNLKIEAIEDEFYIPSVDFNADTGVCEIAGESYIEQTQDFYEPLLDWLHEFMQTEKKKLTFNLKLAYYNTSTSKKILEILELCKRHELKGYEIEFNWFFDGEDLDIEEDIEDFKQISGLNIAMIDDNKL